MLVITFVLHLSVFVEDDKNGFDPTYRNGYFSVPDHTPLIFWYVNLSGYHSQPFFLYVVNNAKSSS